MQNDSRILIVEDNATTARTLRIFLQSEGYSVAWAESGGEGLRQFDASHPSLVVLDLMMPDLDGLSVCKQIRTRSTVPIVMLTAKTSEDEIVEGLEAGADDYICKPFGSKELLARIRRCLRSHALPSEEPSEVVEVGEISIDLRKRAASVNRRPVKLTKSEFDLLALLMRNPGRVFTRDQMIERALGPDFDGFDRTIDTHIWSLRKKIGEPKGAPRYIQSELGVGYRLRDGNED